jgi:hypothetical protein
MRRVSSLVSLVTAGVVGLGVLGSPASAAYGDNFVQSHATAQDKLDERSNVMVVTNATDDVENGNLAEAVTGGEGANDYCDGCRAVAVAFQVVLVPGSPHTVKPGNLASAANLNCDHCVAIAIAKQYVLYTRGARSIDRDAQRQVADINRRVHAIAVSGVDGATMQSQLEPLYDRLIRVVRDGLQGEGSGASSERSRAA